MTRTSKYAFVDYACRYWADHLRQSKFRNSIDEVTTTLLDWFLYSKSETGRYISWQQMYHHDIKYYCPGRPPLYYAIEFRIDALVSLLLPPKDELDTLIHGTSTLHVAARSGALSTVRELLRRGASIELKSGGEAKSMTALHFAAEGGHADVIRLLLALGASPHARSSSSSTPFYRAARSGSLKALRVLYDAGSDINAETWDSFTPLFEAVAHGRPQIATQLLEWGADPTIAEIEGESAISLIALHKNALIAEDDDLLILPADILREIQEIRARGAEGHGFQNYLVGLRELYIYLSDIEKDIRPGSEREKDHRYGIDVRASIF
jgi:hypothetical protein